MRHAIRIVAADANAKGDILTRLSKDLFYVLGYDDCRVNVNKTGREIDVIGRHRFEARRLIAECKNQIRSTGGSDTNKFAGILDIERRANPSSSVQGYFVSLSGFTGAAIEQERECGESRFTMLDGAQVASELATGNIVITSERAIGIAEMVASRLGKQMKWDGSASLLGYSGGWAWQIGLKCEKWSGSCLIHADGTPMTGTAANQLVTLAEEAKDELATVALLNSRLLPQHRQDDLKIRYLEYLVREFGAITLEGLPADQEVHSRQFRLENLYVPLGLSPVPTEPLFDVVPENVSGDDLLPKSTNTFASLESTDYEWSSEENEDYYEPPITHTLGEVLGDHQRIAILGLPGSGKTTLLKRLAVAYASPDRLSAGADGLPQASWFPILLRCRSLGASVRQPILQVLAGQAEQAEFIHAKEEFQTLVSSELLDGRLLLLIDGLDEIGSTSDRAAFVAQLRTFIGRYPNCRVVVTSRESGFRTVATAVQSVCNAFRVNSLDDSAIQTLTRYWHHEVIGRSADVTEEAERLSKSIINTDRVRRLAENPLLLTTLLLVRRWVGQLPRKRTVLYQKAVEVLLMTWNVEGHEPLDPDETNPQLAYAAYQMLVLGDKTATADELAEHFLAARRDLPEILGYARTSVKDFIARVEERSSLLTLSGHRLVDGEIKPTYEFKHLTFQEYFTALAVVNGWVPRELQDCTPVDILSSRLNSASWTEVVALTAVLAGKKATSIVEQLLSDTPNRESESAPGPPRLPNLDGSPRFTNVLNCLVDEASIGPELATAAILFCLMNNSKFRPFEGIELLYGGRYDNEVRRIALDRLKMADEHIDDFASAIAQIAYLDVTRATHTLTSQIDWLLQRLDSDQREDQLYGAGALTLLLYHHGLDSAGADYLSEPVKLIIERILRSDDLHLDIAFMYIWTLAWGVQRIKFKHDLVNRLQVALVRIWFTSSHLKVSRYAAWTLFSSPHIGRWNLPENERNDLRRLADEALSFEGPDEYFFRNGALTILYYLTPPKQRVSLVQPVVKVLRSSLVDEYPRMLLSKLGEEGRAALQHEFKVRRSVVHRRRSPT